MNASVIQSRYADFAKDFLSFDLYFSNTALFSIQGIDENIGTQPDLKRSENIKAISRLSIVFDDFCFSSKRDLQKRRNAYTMWAFKTMEAIWRLSIVFGDLCFSSKRDTDIIQCELPRPWLLLLQRALNMTSTYVSIISLRLLCIWVEKVIDHYTRKFKNQNF